MSLNWYPGHMAKTFRLLKNDLQRVSLVIELVDARIPQSSRNPKISELIEGKDHLLLMTKSDLAQPEITNAWESHFKGQGQNVAKIDLKRSDALKQIERQLQGYLKAQEEKDRRRGRLPRPLSIACLGIPNVGKSTLSNLLLGKQSQKTENRPGLTRQISFIRSRNKKYELMDSPGLLWPKLETKEQQVRLALCMAIPDSLLSQEELALDFLLLWGKMDPIHYERIMNEAPSQHVQEAFFALERYCVASNLLLKGGVPDIERGAERLIRDFRRAKLGAISLEHPAYDVQLPL